MARCQNDPTCEWLLWAASIQHVSKFWILIRMLLANGFLRSKYHDSALNGNQRSLWGAQDHKTNTSHPNSWNNMATTLLKNHYLFNRENKALIQYLYIIVIIFGLPKFYQHFLSSVLNTSMMPWCRYEASLAGTINAQHCTAHLGSQSHKNHKATGTCHSTKNKTMDKQKQHPGTGWFGSLALVDSDHCLMIQFFSREKQQSFKRISVVYPSWFTRSSVA